MKTIDNKNSKKYWGKKNNLNKKLRNAYCLSYLLSNVIFCSYNLSLKIIT